MATERVILCGGVGGGDLPFDDGSPLALTRYGASRNVRLKADDVTRALARSLAPPLADLLDIAAYVYVADQAVSRGSPNAVNLGTSWRRRLHFRVPVRVPDFWRETATLGALTGVLSFLSDDVYEFDFRPWSGGAPAAAPFLDFQASSLTGAVDEVVLFSGGLDSLGGAVKEVVNRGRRVLLLNHRSSPKLAGGVEQLVKRLGERAGANRPEFMAVWANKSESLSREYTQRSRSFLYASLGAAVAHTIGLNRVRFYENGVISLNLPLSGQVIGARATRTTHPRVLAGFAELFTRVTGTAFAVENPFFWKTKADVARLIGEAGMAGAIGHSCSCAHTWAKPAGKTHCGDCSQCVDRRFAILAAGLAAHDPAEGYAVDLLLGDRPKEDSRLLIAGYLETVRRVEAMPEPRQFFGRFAHELTRAVRFLPVGAEVGARMAYDLIRRHSKQVQGVVERGIADNASRIADRGLPAHCLLRQVVSPAPGVPAPPPAAAPSGGESANMESLRRHTFRGKGECWEVGLAGSAPAILRDSVGAKYIHALIAAPGESVSSLELVRRVEKHEKRYDLTGGGGVTDAEALSAYKARHDDIQAELEVARKNNDTGAAERLERERVALVSEITRATGLGGRPRCEATPSTRAAKAVTEGIRRAMGKLGQVAPELAAHIRKNLAGGANRAYTPPLGESWDC